MAQQNSPVDELANLRARIIELRAREATLEVRFIDQRNQGFSTGRSGNVVVSHTSHHVFDISKLPDAILNDPALYTLRQVTTVRIEPHEDIGNQSWLASAGVTNAASLIEHQ